MATTTPFAYNPSLSPISGTDQVGTLAVGITEQDYSIDPGGVIWWNGPDEELGYVITVPVSGNTQPTPIPGVFASVGFNRSADLTEGSFVELTNNVFNQSFTNGTECKTWLNDNGYWTSFVPPPSTPTPTPTNTQTPTPTPTPTETEILTPTPTETPTPTPTDLSLITTYTISGCTSLSVFVADLNSPNLFPGDTNNIVFTGATPSGCYTILGKTNTTPTDGILSGSFYTSCSECINQTTTVYSISGCTNMVTLNADLVSPNFFPGDVLKLPFTGATPTGCYTVIEKVFDTPSEDTIITTSFFLNCALCEASLVTPTPTVTQTPTPTGTAAVTPTPSVTNTQTPTVTTTGTPTPTPTSGGVWGFYLANGGTITRAPNFNGDALFSYSGSSNAVYNPNYTGGTFNIYFNNNNKAGTSYFSQFTTLKDSGGTITINQGSSTAIYSGTSSNYSGSTGTFLRLIVNRSAQMIQSASTQFVSGTTINVVVS